MSYFRRVELMLTPTGQGSTVTIDGVELKNVTAVKVEAGVELPTMVTVSFYAEVKGYVETAVVGEFRKVPDGG